MNIVVNENGSLSLLDLNTRDMTMLLDALCVHSRNSEQNGAPSTAKAIRELATELNNACTKAAGLRVKKQVAAKRESTIDDSR